MGCTVLEFLLAADLLTASQLRSEGIPLVIFDLLNLIVYPNLYGRSGAHIAKAVKSDLSFTGGVDDAVGTLRARATTDLRPIHSRVLRLTIDVPLKPPQTPS
jgi:hypothetical protein